MEATNIIVYANEQNRLEPDAENLLKQDVVTIARRQWHKQQYSQKCLLIKEWKGEEMRLWKNQHPSIILDLAEIGFPRLHFLNLSSNMIETIEPLVGVFMPQLTCISLVSNNITCLQSIRKVSWPYLHKLYLYGNPITEYLCLCEFYCEQLRALNLNLLAKVQFEDDRVLMKLETEQLARLNLGIRIKENIGQPRTHQAIRRKLVELRRLR